VSPFLWVGGDRSSVCGGGVKLRRGHAVDNFRLEKAVQLCIHSAKSLHGLQGVHTSGHFAEEIYAKIAAGAVALGRSMGGKLYFMGRAGGTHAGTANTTVMPSA